MKDMLVQVEPLIPALRRYPRALTRERAAAEDLVQNCLERAVSRWHKRSDGSVRSEDIPAFGVLQGVKVLSTGTAYADAVPSRR